MLSNEYKIIITTPSYPKGVIYPSRGERLYTREEAISHLRAMGKRGRPSDYKSKHGAYAESNSERFTLEDIDEF